MVARGWDGEVILGGIETAKFVWFPDCEDLGVWCG